MQWSDTNLTQEEYALLSCSKDGWYKKQERYTQFMDILKRYIELWGTAVSIDFIDFCFPEITFNGDLIGNRGMQMINCSFYGKVSFKDTVFKEECRIQDCIFHQEAIYKNLLFNGEATWVLNSYKQQVTYQSLTFKDEFFLSSQTYEDHVAFEKLEFCSEADFNSLDCKKEFKIIDLKGIEFFKWDDLICVYNSPQCEWDDQELFLENYFKKNPDDLKTFKLANELKEVFPEEMDRVNQKLIDNDWSWSCYYYIEYFGSITKQYLGKKEYAKAKRHLDFFENKLRTSDKELTHLISVAYVENILWQLNHKQQKEAWKYIPPRVKGEYEKIWSPPR